jgi:hypothetical protein
MQQSSPNSLDMALVLQLLMYLIYIAEGESKTSHYALATGFMALGMMLPGMLSGYIQVS